MNDKPDLPDAATDLRRLAVRIGSELAEMTGLAETVQLSLSDILQGSPKPPEKLAELQAIDRLTQLLSNLSRLLPAMADAMPQGGFLADAELDRIICLKELLVRLVSDQPAPQTNAGGATGQVQWL